MSGRSRARPDHYSREAKRQSYPARSIFKLEEIDRKHGLLRQGMAVLDLGAAPGSWLRYASARVGPTGFVLGLDVHRLPDKPPANARFVKGDALETPVERLLELAARPFDVVLSDMAPHTTGNRFVDQQRSLRLVLRALEIAGALGKRGAGFVGKIFHGEDIGEARQAAETLFGRVKLVRPKAVRKGSYELYLVALDKKTDAARPVETTAGSAPPEDADPTVR